MNAGRIATLLGTAALVLAQTPAAACGDKLSMMGGGVSFELVNPTRHRGNVVMFIAPESPLHASKHEQNIQKLLQRAGHTVRVLDTPADLATALQAGNVDIVLTDFGESPATPRSIANEPNATAEPASLALMYRPTAADFAATKFSHTCVARIDQQRGRPMLDAIENVLATKGKVVATTCSPASATSST